MGPVIEINQDITKKDYMKMCELITDHLNSYYSVYHKSFPFTLKVIPEPISEGGLLIQYYDKNGNLLNNFYKSMRINNKPYPWVNINELEFWKKSDDIVYKSGPCITFLKAFDEAPQWNADELVIFLKDMKEFNISFVSSFPSNRKLKSKIEGANPYKLKGKTNLIVNEYKMN